MDVFYNYSLLLLVYSRIFNINKRYVSCKRENIAIAITNIDKFYTLSSFGLASVLLFLFSFKKYKWFYNFLRTYLFSLIALVVVNGVLTGSFIENEIVSYNENHFMGYRIFTIPIEDTIYCFSMLFIVTGIYEKLKN